MRERYEPLLRDDPCPHCGAETEYADNCVSCVDCNQTAYVLGASPVRYYEDNGRTKRVTVLMRDRRHSALPASEEVLVIETQQDNGSWTPDTVLGDVVAAP